MATARRALSPYYPPRARWYSPLLAARDRAAHEMALDRLNPALGANVRLIPLVLGFFVPGLAFYFRMPGIIGRLALAWVGLLLVAFVILLGRPWDNLIYAMLLSVHVSGFVLYCNPLLSSALRDRLLFTILMVVLIQALVYYPVQMFTDQFLVTPVRWRDNVVVVSHVYSTKTIRPGDLLAYRASGGAYYETEGEYRWSGLDVAPVLALPGDQVAFSADAYSVNGVPHPLLPHMPREGSFVVPQKEWFVWPNLAIEVYHDSEAAVSERLMQQAMVTEEQLIGIPFQRWFWWKQNLS